MKLRIISAILGALFLASPASAQMSYNIRPYLNGKAILVIGLFERNDDLAAFEKLIVDNHPAYVFFNSPGGDLLSSIHHGEIIRKYGLTTKQIQMEGIECASACVYAFMGGEWRMAQSGALGIHQATLPHGKFNDQAELISDVQTMIGAILQYMDVMGVDLRLAQYIFSTKPEDLIRPNQEQMLAYHLTTEQFEDEVKPDPTINKPDTVSNMVLHDPPIPEPKPQQ